MMLGVGEIIMVLVVALMVLGPKRMPEVMRQVAKWLNQMRRMADDVKSQVEDALDETKHRPSSSRMALPPLPTAQEELPSEKDSVVKPEAVSDLAPRRPPSEPS